MKKKTDLRERPVSNPDTAESCSRCGGALITEVDERGLKDRFCLDCRNREPVALRDGNISLRRPCEIRMPWRAK